ncbi:MAG TPA: hypothetical protein VJ464_01950 [Blastocatellia bacterium]|nr:hypothetical protein [Blastocatellia bacterium]
MVEGLFVGVGKLDLFAASLGLGAGGAAAEEAGEIVMLDTNAVIKFEEASTLLGPGEIPVVSEQVMTELNALVERGTIDALPSYKSGSVPPPIQVNPGIRGIPLRHVFFK